MKAAAKTYVHDNTHGTKPKVVRDVGRMKPSLLDSLFLQAFPGMLTALRTAACRHFPWSFLDYLWPG